MVNILFSIIKVSLLSLLLIFSFTEVRAQEAINVLSEQTGTASYYNKNFNGKKTTSGEKLDNGRYTAAHGTLSFGTMVRVTNLSNGKSVVVKVNDRFSRRNRYLIDITYSAAQKIDMVRQGIARVKVEVLDLSEAEAEAEAIVPRDTITFRISEKFIPIPVETPRMELPTRL